jgi:protein-tyrosine phosphatase
MNGFVDIHAHVLPGIDDGPADLDDALTMLRAAADSGTATLVATPHLRDDFPDVHVRELAGRCAELRDRIATESLGLDLICGAEVSLVWAIDATDEDLSLASVGQLGTDLLIETPFTSTVGLETMLYGLRARGFRVTLAHPERSREFQHDRSPLVRLAEQGVLLQVNADTLVGNVKKSATARLGAELCLEGLAGVIASDGHRGHSWRPVGRLAEAVAAATELVGPDRAQWMAIDAPRAIVEGRPLPEPPAVVTRRRGLRFWN